MSLKKKLVLVTGGGSGIGEACCILAAEEGATVAVADINLDAANTILKHIGKGKGDHAAFQVDVSSEKAVEALSEAVQKAYGGRVPDCVIHCAGIARNLCGLEGSTGEEWERVIGVNLSGTFFVDKKFALLMKRHGIKGSIVNLSSINAKGLWNSCEYAASKGGVDALTKSLGKELGPWSIRVNAVAPGAIDTPMARRATGDAPNMVPAVPLEGRFGQAKEVAELCVFLVSDRSSYITASVHEIHGGYDIVPGKANKDETCPIECS